MKHFTFNFRKRFFNLALMMGAVLLSFGVWAQPVVVEVPLNCEVVVAGTGGTTGFGGEVGHGGIVIMPDPGNGSFTIHPNGATLITWSLLGDLSFTDYLNPIDQSRPATISPETIYSYNKNPRPSESDPPITPDKLARSKGRVYVSYDVSSCGGRIEFDIYKKYSNTSGIGDEYVPPIIGPKCWLANETYTYSVDQIASDNIDDGIGVDKYYWTIKDKDDNVIYDSESDPTNYPDSYTSADRSSITTVAPANLNPPYTISCCFGRANNWDGDGVYTSPPNHTTCVELIIGGEPLLPLVIIPECVPVGSPDFTAEIDLINNNPNYNPNWVYTWSSDNPAWTFNPTSGTNTTSTVVSSLGEGPGNIILTIDNLTCFEPKEFIFPVNRSFQDPDVTISGPTCISPGANYTFSLEPSGVQANDAVWTLPTGWNIVNTNGTNTVIEVSVPASAQVGSYPISATSSVTACSTTSVDLDVYIKPDEPVFLTTGGDSPICVDYDATSQVTYTVSSSTGATGYEWTFPSTWNPSSTSTLVPTVNVTPAGDGTASGIVSVTALGYGNCSSNPVNYPIGYNAIRPDNIPSDLCWNFGLEGTTVITVDNVPDPFFGDYNVSSNPPGLIEGIPTVDANGVITITTSASASGNYDLIIEHATTANCGPETETFPINVVGNGSSITPLYDQGMADIFIANVVSGASFIWTLLDANGDIISHPTPPSPGVLTLSGNDAPPAQVCIDVTLDGCKTRYCVPAGNYSESIVYPGSQSNHRLNDHITIYPNPTSGTFSIDLTNVEKVAELQLFDIQGRLINNYILSNGKNTISEDISSGTYLLLINVDGEFSAHKIEVDASR